MEVGFLFLVVLHIHVKDFYPSLMGVPTMKVYWIENLYVPTLKEV